MMGPHYPGREITAYRTMHMMKTVEMVLIHIVSSSAYFGHSDE